MQFVNISERKPTRKAEYFVIVDDYKSVAIFDGEYFWSNDMKLNVTKWLDEGLAKEGQGWIEPKDAKEGIWYILAIQSVQGFIFVRTGVTYYYSKGQFLYHNNSKDIPCTESITACYPLPAPPSDNK